MAYLFIENIPRSTSRTDITNLLTGRGRLQENRILSIDIQRGRATVNVPEERLRQLTKRLDGTIVQHKHIQVWHDPIGDVHPHFAKMLKWLTWEQSAEQERSSRTTIDSSRVLKNLQIEGEEIGLGGLYILQLSASSAQVITSTRIKIGFPVKVLEEGQPSEKAVRGVATRLHGKTIHVVLNRAMEFEDRSATIQIELASDEVSIQRMRRALIRADSVESGRLANLRDVLLGKFPATFDHSRPKKWLKNKHLWGYDELDDSQKEAVEMAISAEDIAIIHGPPGTGKTTTAVNFIRGAIANGETVLATAHSNYAVDLLCEKLLSKGIKVIRIGHPARITPILHKHTLSVAVEKHDTYLSANKLRKTAYELQANANKWRRSAPAPGEKKAMRAEANALFNEARELEALAVEQVLDKAQVILGTLIGLDSSHLGTRRFDWCVLDEAGQTTEPASWIPLSRCERLVLAGDHQQLPPTVISPKAEKAGLGISLMERLMYKQSDLISRLLTIQYRMHEDIMAFSSENFYQNRLVAHETVQDRLLTDLPMVRETALTSSAVTFIDTAGASYEEEKEPYGTSIQNPLEAKLVVKKVRELLDAGILPIDIGVIAPYAAQVKLIADMLPHSSIEVGSVDRLQGREKEAIVMGFVRSNREGNIGFLKETRRINVAMTRAQRKLILIADGGTFSQHPFYDQLIAFLEQKGWYQSVWDEMYTDY